MLLDVSVLCSFSVDFSLVVDDGVADNSVDVFSSRVFVGAARPSEDFILDYLSTLVLGVGNSIVDDSILLYSPSFREASLLMLLSLQSSIKFLFQVQHLELSLDSLSLLSINLSLGCCSCLHLCLNFITHYLSSLSCHDFLRSKCRCFSDDLCPGRRFLLSPTL